MLNITIKKVLQHSLRLNFGANVSHNTNIRFQVSGVRCQEKVTGVTEADDFGFLIGDCGLEAIR